MFLSQWRVELEEILEIAQADSDRWVSVMAEILRNFPTAYTLNVESFEVKENKRIFDDLMHDLKKQRKLLTHRQRCSKFERSNIHTILLSQYSQEAHRLQYVTVGMSLPEQIRSH